MQWREYFFKRDSLILSAAAFCVESAYVVCVGFLQVIQFVPTVQTHAGELKTLLVTLNRKKQVF